MKKSIGVIIGITILTTGIVFARCGNCTYSGPMDECCKLCLGPGEPIEPIDKPILPPEENFVPKRSQKKQFEQRLKNAVEKGIITQQQADELIKMKKELEEYNKTIWTDDKMTKEEKKRVEQMRKEFREKVRTVLDEAMKKWHEKHKDEKSQGRLFNERIDKAVKNGKITQQQADELKKQREEIEKLETEIWSDGAMTKEEREKLYKARKEFGEKVRNILAPGQREKCPHEKGYKKGWKK